MRAIGFKISLCVFVLALSLGVVSCGLVKRSGGNSSSLPTVPAIFGVWDFTAIDGAGNLIAIEAYMQENASSNNGSGTISSSGTVVANGPGGANVFVYEYDIFGPSLSAATNIAIDYLGNTCSTDDGTRSLTGTINASGQVSFTYDVGGSFSLKVNGSLNASGTTFSGSGTVSAPGCKANGRAITVTGALIDPPNGPAPSTLPGTTQGRVPATAPIPST